VSARISFDRIARPYRMLEYLTLGQTLERTRMHFLARLGSARNALVLGDGDGRFLARLLAVNPGLRATAIDSSAEMLRLLRERCSPYADRLETLHCDVMRFTPDCGVSYDLVVTHFFLDCFEESQLEALMSRLIPVLAPGALWLVSDFCIPSGALRFPAKVLIRGLYFAFRILTGLRTTQLPQHDVTLSMAGFDCVDRKFFLGGILTTEIWQRASVRHNADPQIR
jgi:ubiquinone/menaquinone biosynthesis C-methylase UbiE